jgi:flagellar biosynthesis protein FlhG
MVDLNVNPDQASGLRRLVQQRPIKVMAVTGGKGGVGKTNVCANLALALRRRGRRVMVMDGDLGLANLDILLGVRATRTLEHVFNGQCDLRDAVVRTPSDLLLLPAASGNYHLAQLSPAQHAGLVQAFSDLLEPVDVLLVDTAAGLGDAVLTFSEAAHHVLVVVCDEPTALTDAYGLIKSLSRRGRCTEFQVISNMVGGGAEGRVLFDKLARVSRRFLDNARLTYLGHLPFDPFLRRAVQAQAPVVEAFPGSPSSRAFKKLAGAADNLKTPDVAPGHLTFFIEQMVGLGEVSQEDTLQ